MIARHGIKGVVTRSPSLGIILRLYVRYMYNYDPMLQPVSHLYLRPSGERHRQIYDLPASIVRSYPCSSHGYTGNNNHLQKKQSIPVYGTSSAFGIHPQTQSFQLLDIVRQIPGLLRAFALYQLVRPEHRPASFQPISDQSSKKVLRQLHSLSFPVFAEIVHPKVFWEDNGVETELHQ
jgi:hypothetical protein